MNPDRNNDSSVLFRWKEFSMSLNLTAKEFKQGELFIRETIRSRRKIVNFLLFSTRSDGTAWKEKCIFPQWYKRTILSIKSISGNPRFFDRLPLVYRWLYFSGSNGTCRSASFRICNFAQVITAAYLPRIFMANNASERFHRRKIAASSTYHFTQRNILDIDWALFSNAKRMLYLVSDGPLQLLLPNCKTNPCKSSWTNKKTLTFQWNDSLFRLIIPFRDILLPWKLLSDQSVDVISSRHNFPKYSGGILFVSIQRICKLIRNIKHRKLRVSRS